MARLHVDVSDLFDHFAAFGNVTGVQRVGLELARQLTLLRPEARLFAFAHGPGVPIVLPRDLLFAGHDMIDALNAGDPLRLALEGPRTGRAPWSAAFPRPLRPPLVVVRAGLAGALGGRGAAHLPKGVDPARPEPGDMIFVAGAIWGQRAHVRRLGAMSRAGVRVFVVIHDLIAERAPELTDAVTRRLFERFFDDVSGFAAGLLCVSEATRRDVEAKLARMGRAHVRVETLALAHEFLGDSGAPDGPPPHPRVRALDGTRFALIVGTVEVRKNHLRLAQAWRSLMAEHGERVPPLVVAGKFGWKVEPFRALMAETGWLGGRVVHIDGATDRDLAWLYRHCAFSVFPSTFEGFGLPVAEGAWFGRPCVTSNVTSMPEILGEASILCDPLDVHSIADAVRPLIVDPAALAEATARVRAHPKRRWSDVAARALALMDA